MHFSHLVRRMNPTAERGTCPPGRPELRLEGKVSFQTPESSGGSNVATREICVTGSKLAVPPVRHYVQQRSCEDPPGSVAEERFPI